MSCKVRVRQKRRFLNIYGVYWVIMPSFLATRKKTKTKRPVSFTTSSGQKIKFKARRKPLRRTRVEF